MPTILIVDDAQEFRSIMARLLDAHGFTVSQAENGVEACKILRKDPIDIVLMDVVMPLMGGIDTLMDLKGEVEGLKVILMTGKVSRESEAFQSLVTKLGVKHLLFKPFKEEELLGAINELLKS